MASTSNRTINLSFTGDHVASPAISAAANAASPAAIAAPITLSSGDNTITVPTGGTTPTAVTITKPAGNTNAIKLKGVGGDTGVTLHLTDPDSISLAASQATFILNAAGTITGVTLVWS
jgi:hypothetical protein